MKLTAANWIFLALLAGLIWVGTGCATDDPENVSVRPWNSPSGSGENPMLDSLSNQHE